MALVAVACSCQASENGILERVESIAPLSTEDPSLLSLAIRVRINEAVADIVWARGASPTALVSDATTGLPLLVFADDWMLINDLAEQTIWRFKCDSPYLHLFRDGERFGFSLGAGEPDHGGPAGSLNFALREIASGETSEASVERGDDNRLVARYPSFHHDCETTVVWKGTSKRVASIAITSKPDAATSWASSYSKISVNPPEPRPWVIPEAGELERITSVNGGIKFDTESDEGRQAGTTVARSFEFLGGIAGGAQNAFRTRMAILDPEQRGDAHTPPGFDWNQAKQYDERVSSKLKALLLTVREQNTRVRDASNDATPGEVK